MISLMAAVMATQAGLVRQVQYNTSTKRSAGAAAAAMLFVFQGAFTVGFQATVWVYPYVKFLATLFKNCFWDSLLDVMLIISFQH